MGPLVRPISPFIPPLSIPPVYIPIFCTACTDKQESHQAEFVRIETDKVTISKAVFDKSTPEGLFVKNCVVNIEKATIKFKSTVDEKVKKKVIRIKDITIHVEEAKVDPQSLLFAARKCSIASHDWTLISDKVRVVTDKIVIKPVAF